MTITSGSVVLKKDAKNLVGISIGGGAPYCPCLYVVQVFDKTSAAGDGSLLSGDEITGVNGKSVKGKSRLQVAKMIQEISHEVTINYNKLHADAEQGKCLDLVLKKMKHRVVETMSSSTADALGLSRAILCNDALVKKLEDLEKTAQMFRGLISHTRRILRAMLGLADMYRGFADIFGVIGVHDPFPSASETFTAVGITHRELERLVVRVVRALKPMISDLGTFLNHAIPDIRLTIKKYADIKFEYLSYCLKVKEMDDEEYSAAVIDDPLYRVETGNYDYRVVLRCRQLARARFAKSRSDVMVKLELLESKHVQDTVFQLQRLVGVLKHHYDDSLSHVQRLQTRFPVEIELNRVSGVGGGGKANYEDNDDDDDDDVSDDGDADEALEEEPVPGDEDLLNGASQPSVELLLDLG